MTTINLYQNKEESEGLVSSRNTNKGFYFSISVLLAVVAVFFGLKMYIPILEKENAALEQNVADENNKIVGLKNLESVIDLQKRLAEIKNNLQIKNGEVARLEMNHILNDLAGDMNPGVVVSEYGYDKGEITVKMDANNFSDVAKQILNFKKSNHFTDVNLAEISRQEQGISCSIAMKLKK